MSKNLHKGLRKYYIGGYTANELQTKFKLTSEQIEVINKHYKFEKHVQSLIQTVGSKTQSYYNNEDQYGTIQPTSKHKHQLIQIFNNNLLEDQILKDLDNGAQIENIAKHYKISENYINIVKQDYGKIKR